MKLAEDFLTDTEEEAFEDFLSQPEAGPGLSIRDRMQAAWLASRDYFTQDRAEDETAIEAGVNPGYFDERRAGVRLQILSMFGPSGLTTKGDVTEAAKQLEAWVLGE